MRLVPGIAMLSRYRRSDLGPDLLAAATITGLLIPSGLAYVALAGLSPVAGLYTGVLGMIGFALFTTSRVLVVGPESQMAILVAAALAPLAPSGPAEYATLAAAMALLSAVICVLAMSTSVSPSVFAPTSSPAWLTMMMRATPARYPTSTGCDR